MQINKYALAIILAGVMTAGVSQAATQSVTSNIKFDTPLTLTKNTDIQFGTVKAGAAGTYAIDATNTVTPSAGGIWLYGTPAAGSLTVAGSATDTVTISTGGYTASNGVTPSAATCKYGSGTATACDAGISVAGPGANTALLVGVQVVADGSQIGGSTATPSFTVTAVYN